MATLDRRKFLQMVGLGSAVALLPPIAAAEEEYTFEFPYDGNPDYDFEEAPFCVEVTVNFNNVLMDDEDARFAVFYADRFDSEGNPILIAEGQVGGRDKIAIEVEDKSNVVCRAMGLKHAQFCESRMFVQHEPTLHMVAGVERNYDNT